MLLISGDYLRFTFANGGRLRLLKLMTSIKATNLGATTTTDEVLQGVDLRGKRILVTGVSAGIGVETARTLAAHGASVVGAARDLTKAERATAQVRAGRSHGRR